MPSRSFCPRPGSVVEVYLPADRETGRPRGFAFVQFGNEAEAAEAIRLFHDREVDGRKLTVNAAEDRPPRRDGPRSFDATARAAAATDPGPPRPSRSSAREAAGDSGGGSAASEPGALARRRADPPNRWDRDVRARCSRAVWPSGGPKGGRMIPGRSSVPDVRAPGRSGRARASRLPGAAGVAQRLAERQPPADLPGLRASVPERLEGPAPVSRAAVRAGARARGNSAFPEPRRAPERGEQAAWPGVAAPVV